MAYGGVCATVVLVHSAVTPGTQEWAGYVERLASYNPTGPRTLLVVTAGGAPNAAQRRALFKLGYDEFVVAVITGSMFHRGIITAIGWGGAKIRGYRPSEIDVARTFLDRQPAEWSSLRSLADDLQEKLRMVAPRPMPQ